MTTQMCMEGTNRHGWTCEMEVYENWPGKEHLKQEDMENFSVAADGTTA